MTQAAHNSPTGNPTRDAFLYEAIANATEKGEPITVANLGLEWLPPDFDLQLSELEAAQRVLAANDGAIPEPEAERPTMTLAEVNSLLVAKQNELSHARGDLLGLENRRRTAREKLGDAITFFQKGLMKITREQLQREHIRSEQELKQGVADGKISPRRSPGRPGPSAVDRAGFYQRGGSVNSRGGNAFRRGGYGIENKGMGNADPRRGAVFMPPKVPSDR